MNAYTVISAVLEFYDAVATSSDNSTLRAKALNREQEIVDELWQEFGDEGDFTQAQSTVTLASGTSSIELPSDFMTFGTQGGAILRRSATDRSPLVKWPTSELFKLLEENGSTTGEPTYFAVSQWNGSDFVPKLHVDLLADANYTIAVYYTKRPPTLSDSNTSTSGLEYLPTEFHRSLVYKGTLARYSKDVGNQVQAQAFEAEYRAALAAAKNKRSLTSVGEERIGGDGYAKWRMW